MNAAKQPRPEQPWLIRLAHWANVPLLVILAGSGLQILVAYPRMGPTGQLYRWYPFQGWIPPAALRLGGWLAGARSLHFGLGLFFTLNGFIYVAYFCISGEWRRRLFLPGRDLSSALETAKYYVRIRKTPPAQGLYNGLQRAGYTSALVFGVLMVLTGIVLYKPVQFPRLTWLFGGYDVARVLHFAVLAALVGFTLGHVLMVVLHPRTFVAMVTGGKRE